MEPENRPWQSSKEPGPHPTVREPNSANTLNGLGVAALPTPCLLPCETKQRTVLPGL